ncbi:unnamed protein product, partial [Polarella glacialis]
IPNLDVTFRHGPAPGRRDDNSNSNDSNNSNDSSDNNNSNNSSNNESNNTNNNNDNSNSNNSSNNSNSNNKLLCVATACRNIASGEELTIQYTAVIAIPYSQRQDQFLRQWNFTCSCVRCDAESHLSTGDSDWLCAGCTAFDKADRRDS